MSFRATDVKRAVKAAIDGARLKGLDVGPIETSIAADGRIVVRIEPAPRIAALSRHAEAKKLADALTQKRQRGGTQGRKSGDR